MGDVNRDGSLDIAAANRSSDNLSVLLGDGEGGFATEQTFAAGRGPTSVVMGDLNGDGFLDLVSANSYADDLSVLWGDGEGGFAPQQTFTVRDNPSSVVVGDVNGDGLLDLATANRESDNVSVLLGDGEGGFAPQQTFTVGGFPTSVVMGDVNGDGLLDLATANQGSDSLSVLSSRIYQGSATRLVQSNLSPCLPTSSPLREDSSFLPGLTNCRIDRLELDLNLPPGSQGRLSLRSPLDHEIELLTFPNSRFTAGRARPEIVTALARFESHPLRGLWTLNAQSLALDGGQMIVNSYPEDPFDPDTLADPCTSEADQLTDPDFACRLDVGSLEGATLEDDDDEDVFLLQGDFDGAFVRSQTIHVVVDAAPGIDLAVELRAFRAEVPLEVALESAPGQWTLSFTVPPDYSRRYFAVHVKGRGVADISYDILMD
jgi:hypothetical protein